MTHLFLKEPQKKRRKTWILGDFYKIKKLTTLISTGWPQKTNNKETISTFLVCKNAQIAMLTNKEFFLCHNILIHMVKKREITSQIIYEYYVDRIFVDVLRNSWEENKISPTLKIILQSIYNMMIWNDMHIYMAITNKSKRIYW